MRTLTKISSIVLAAAALACAVGNPAGAQSDAAAKRRDLAQKHAREIGRLGIPSEICSAPIIDTNVSPVAELGTFCEYAALLLEGAADKQVQILPMVSFQTTSQSAVGLPMRTRGHDDVTCLFRNLRGDLILLGAIEGDGSTQANAQSQILSSFVCLGLVAQLNRKPDTQAEAKPQPPTPSSASQPKKVAVDNMVDSILKNSDANPSIKTPQQQSKQLASAVTASEVEGIRQKIRPCWNSVAGARDAPVIALIVHLDQQGAPVDAQFKDPGRLSDPAYRATAEAARRAVMNSRCQPWPLSPEKYSSWHTVTLNFDPRDY